MAKITIRRTTGGRTTKYVIKAPKGTVADGTKNGMGFAELVGVPSGTPEDIALARFLSGDISSEEVEGSQKEKRENLEYLISRRTKMTTRSMLHDIEIGYLEMLYAEVMDEIASEDRATYGAVAKMVERIRVDFGRRLKRRVLVDHLDLLGIRPKQKRNR